MEDITERKRCDERIAHMAHYDALTDLPNRVLFREQLDASLKGIRDGEQLAVLYIDIDEFKSVNDSLGHPVGDELLKAVADRLRGCLRPTDFVARLGGDEFAIIQTAVRHATDTTELVARIYQAIREPFECIGHLVTTDASIGIAMAPQDGTDLDQLLKNADLAMYGAKADGRRTSRFFEPAMDARAKALRLLELDLRLAIADSALELHYQPVVSLADDTVTGCEALLRWHHPSRGLIAPAEFIPVAEETGLINQLGEWVLTTACAEAASWPDDIKVAVNVSPIQFRSPAFALKVTAALAASGLAGAPAGAGDHRSGADPRRRGRARHAASIARARGPDRARRFRHRLFLAELSAALPVRQDQDRPQLHQRHRRTRRLGLHRPGHRQYRHRPADDDDGGGRRDRAAAGRGAQARLHRHAGLSVQPGGAGSGDRGAVAGPATRRSPARREPDLAAAGSAPERGAGQARNIRAAQQAKRKP